jgi:DNA-binding transcriptional regulator YiaG
MLLVHKIELLANNKQATYFSKGCGISRKAYNWALARWKELYESGEKPTEMFLRRELNSIKKEKYPLTKTGSSLTLGGLILAIRRSDEISQLDFAYKLGVSKQYLCDLEHDRNQLVQS